MSDFDRHQDELISAYLDGEADPDETARIEGDPQSRARAAELAAVVQAVADPVQGLTPRERDRLRARALAAAPSPAPVRDISEAARRRWRLVLIPAAAAAGIFAVALGVISLRGGIDDDASETAASAPAATAASSSEMAAQSAADDMGDMAAEPAAPEDFAEEGAEATISATTGSPDGDEAMAEPAAPETEAADDAGAVTDQAPDAPNVADLGSFDGPEQLIDHLTLRLDHAEPALDGPHVEPGPCAEAVADRVAELDGETRIEARAELRIETGGSPEEAGVDLAVITTEDGGFLLVYAAEPGCEIESTALE